jgi:hypothetical protein
MRRTSFALALLALLVAAAPSAHAETLRFTYVGGSFWGSGVVSIAAQTAEPATGRTAPDGLVRFSPSGRSFTLVLHEGAEKAGRTVPVRIGQAYGRVTSERSACVPLGKPFRVTTAGPGTRITLYIAGPEYGVHVCDAPATAGTGAVSWG